MLTQGYTASLVAATLAISRSSLYYQKRPRGSRADRSYDEQIVMACGEKLAYGYRRVTWWLQRQKGLLVNRKRVLRMMRERGLLPPSRRLRARRKKEWGRVEAAEPNQIWQSDLGGSCSGLGIPSVRDRLLVRERSWDGISRIAAGPKTRSERWSRRCYSGYRRQPRGELDADDAQWTHTAL